MDTDCLQEEISVAPERMAALSSNSGLIGRDDGNEAGGKEGSTHQAKGMEMKDGVAGVIPVSRIEAAKRSLEKAMNGTSARRGTEGEEDGDYQISAEIARLRNAGLTSSPSPSFKSSYAKSLADSYRRASIPVVVSSPKGQFYFKNNEFMSLNASPVRDIEGSCKKLEGLTVNGDSITASTQTSKLQSLPPIIDSNKEQQEPESNRKMSDSKLATTCVYEKLLDEDVFVPIEQLHQVYEEQGGSFFHKDLQSLESITTADGRKLMRLSGKFVIIHCFSMCDRLQFTSLCLPSLHLISFCVLDWSHLHVSHIKVSLVWFAFPFVTPLPFILPVFGNLL